jgi:cell division transport system permease protein
VRRLAARLRRPLDLPLEHDGSGRFLPWIVALMVYLAALSLAGMMALQGALDRWDSALAGTLTVQLPPGDEAAIAAALAALRAAPGVVRADLLDEAATAKLVEPWLGRGVDLGELKLPRLVDLHIDPARPFDEAALRQRLAKAAPGARLDDHRRWLDPLLSTALAIEIVAAGIVLLVGAAAVLSIVFATRTGLAIHHGAVEVLHLIGARDTYIAGQFQWQALRLGLRGAVLGLLAAGLTLAALRQAGSAGARLGAVATALPPLALAPGEWAALLLLLPAAGLTALVTARVTVLRILARMP